MAFFFFGLAFAFAFAFAFVFVFSVGVRLEADACFFRAAFLPLDFFVTAVLAAFFFFGFIGMARA